MTDLGLSTALRNYISLFDEELLRSSGVEVTKIGGVLDFQVVSQYVLCAVHASGLYARHLRKSVVVRAVAQRILVIADLYQLLRAGLLFVGYGQLDDVAVACAGSQQPESEK